MLQVRLESVPDNPSANGEVGIVLGSSLKDNRVGAALQERLDRAVALFREGSIEVILVTGGLDREEFDLTEAEGMRLFLLEQGIPDTHIFMEQKATSTYENLLFSQQLMLQHQWHSAVIITHRYHILRAMEIADFLKIGHTQASPVDSQIQSKLGSKLYETAAHLKWNLERLLVQFGIKA